MVELELYPGESIPLSQRPVIACQLRSEKIKKAFSDIFGRFYTSANIPIHVAPSSIVYEKKITKINNNNKRKKE